MPNWTQTLEARQAGALPGFLDVNVPLEEQDEHEGGPKHKQDPSKRSTTPKAETPEKAG